MKERLLQLTGVTVTIAVVSLLMATVAGQAPRTEDRSATAAQSGPLKTSWGEPDLQGIWREDFQVPLQRPAKYAGKEFFTDAERAALDEERAVKPAFGDNRGVKGTEQDVAGAYDSVYTSRRRTGRRTSLIVDPPDGRMPPVTLEVQKRRAEIREFELALIQATETCKNKWRGCEGGTYTGVPSPRRDEPFKYYPTRFKTGGINRMDNPEDHGISYRCMSGNLPDFGGFRQIVQSPGSVSIFYDVGQGQGWHRVIPVTTRPHLPADVRLWWGDSVGRWEGDTLVVDVTNFSYMTDFQGSRENLHLIERWTRTGPTTLEYAVTMDDPTTWTKPWTVKLEMNRQDNQANRIYKEPRCHEGNFGMIGILANTRAEEQAFAEGRGPDPATRDNSVTGNTEETIDLFQ